MICHFNTPWRDQNTSFFFNWVMDGAMEISDLVICPLCENFGDREVASAPKTPSHFSHCWDSYLCWVHIVTPQLISFIWFWKNRICLTFLLFDTALITWWLWYVPDFFKLNIPNYFMAFISLENRGWIGPQSHQGLEFIQNLREEGVGFMVYEGAALGRMAFTKVMHRSTSLSEHILGFSNAFHGH